MKNALPPHIDQPTSILPLAAVIAGPIAMGASPIFVRLAEVGPFASAFWRVGLALPFFWLWWYFEQRNHKSPKLEPLSASMKIALWPGVFFAGDLFFWHLSIMNTSVVNATFFATLAPIAVVFGAVFFLHEPITRNTLAGLGLAMIGGGLLLNNTITQSPEHVLGDIYGLITAVFFAAYMLSLKTARAKMASGKLLFLSTCITSLILLATALIAQDSLWPQSWRGITSLISLAVVSQVGGQGLLAYALGHLPAIFSSLVIFVEPLSAAVLGWAVLGESINARQALGGLCIIISLYISRPRKSRKNSSG